MAWTINDKTKTCSCGMVYSVPDWMEYRTSCPACSSKEIKKLHEEIGKLYKRISSLKGVITKLKIKECL